MKSMNYTSFPNAHGKTEARRIMMKASANLKFLLLLVTAAVLSACGGSSSSDSDGGFTPQGIRVNATAQSTSILSGSTTDITVRVTQANGSPIADGTTVSATVTPVSNGTVVSVDASGALGGTQAQTTGGNATFRFRALGPGGAANVTFSVADPNAPTRTVTASVSITVGPPPPDTRLTLEATTTTLPINAFNVSPFIGSPFMAEVVITVRTASGQAVNAENGVQVSLNPVGSTGGFSTLDDPETEDINEFVVRVGQGPVDVVAGKATIFVHSLNLAGTTVLTVTAQDPETNETISRQLTFTIVSSISSMPAQVFVSPLQRPVYVQGSGGNTSDQIEIQIRDGIGQPVPNPVSGNTAFNNVRVELLGDSVSGGARVSGVNAQGQSVQGTSINLRTTAGISGVLLTSGTQTGSALIRVTADRADNNVDNGISDPVSVERTIFISDGVLFDLEITQPFVNAIVINPVSTGVTVTPPVGGGPTVPPSPDGTYSITVGVIATDRLGNPVIPGTSINFVLIDEPQATGAGDFLIAGSDGNAQEDGFLFTAPSGAFTTAGGGVGPGDAVAIFSEFDPVNRDLEGARVVQSVNGPTSITVQRRWNRNDTTGSIVDAGNVLDYVIGRAADGNITANGVTNEFGVARTTMNYAVSRVGKFAVVWAEGNGAQVNGQAKTVSDVEVLRFAGVAPATLLVSPSAIPGNTTTPVSICVRDALNVPIEAVVVGFAFTGLSGGQGSVDGQPGSGVVASLTGADGCTVALVTTSGVTEDGAQVVFSAAGQSEPVDIEIGTLILTANPPSLLGGGSVITLRLVDGGGNPVPGVQLTGTCTSEGGATVATTPAPGENGVTDSNGETDFSIFTTNLNQANAAGSGVCTYQAPGGEPNVDVPVQGLDLCDAFQSPPIPGCEADGGDLETFTLTINVTGEPGGSIISSPPGVTCTSSAANLPCEFQFPEGTTVTLEATAPGLAAEPIFSGECVLTSSNVGAPPPRIAYARTIMAGDRVCAVEFPPAP